MGKNPDLEKFADFLVSGTVELFKERGDVQFSSPPRKERKKIIEYEGRMRADGMEKFNNQPTYVSAVSFYANQAEMAKKKTLGALIIYVEQNYMVKLMKMLQYPPVDDENENAMQDSCGTLCNIIGGRFKSGISADGYIELEWSHFITYRNSAATGIPFCFNEYDVFQINFDIENKKRLVIEMTMGVVPKR